MPTRRDLLKLTLTLPLSELLGLENARAQDGTTPYFVVKSKLWQNVDFSKGESPFPFSCKDRQLQIVINNMVRVVKNIPLPDDSRNVADIASKIVAVVNDTIKTNLKDTPNEFTQQWLLAEAVCEFVRSKVTYDHTDSVGGTANQTAAVQIARSTWKYIFSLRRPTGVCWGIAVCVRDLARAAGLKCDFVNGICRGFGEPSPSQKSRNHGVVCFTFPGGIEVPADVSSAICADEHATRRSKKTYDDLILPRYPEAWELFTARFTADIGEPIEISGDKQNQHKFLTMSFADWSEKDTTYLKVLQGTYRNWETTR